MGGGCWVLGGGWWVIEGGGCTMMYTLELPLIIFIIIEIWYDIFNLRSRIDVTYWCRCYWQEDGNYRIGNI